MWLLAGLAGCAGPDTPGDSGDDGTTPEPPGPVEFALRFVPTVAGTPVDCTRTFGGLGPDHRHVIGLSDLRFYVSNLELRDAAGAAVDPTLDEDEFQYTGASAWVGLVDLTGDASGTCVPTAISAWEGTARTHDAITGVAVVADVASVSFDVGVPRALVLEVTADTAGPPPSPLAEMTWSADSTYRHLVFDFTVSDEGDRGEGYVDVGSIGCGDGAACTFPNLPRVVLDGFDLATNVVKIDLGDLLEGVDFALPDTVFPGVVCHSLVPDEPDCTPIFEQLGIDPGTGSATADDNVVFGS